jgi:hypothetical protein
VFTEARSRSGNLRLDIAVCDDNVVCLNIEGKQVTVGCAAIRVLDPLLFPQLARLR